ncbi:MAG: hypothetical protein E6Q31_03140 [Aquabacterium sp.]|nr:MAG: hypothetical protein E6Q31_03140 [Aquabacterium sp.]
MFPTFPIGATVHSILLACVQTGKFSSMSAKVPGLPSGVYNYTSKPSLLTRHLFAGELNANDLRLHHTLTPIQLSLIDRRRFPDFPDIADFTEAGLLQWYPYDSPGILRAYVPRLCPQCVEEDTEEFGCGHWRREHQIKSVYICTKHLTALHEGCATPNCDSKPYMRREILPGQPCLACHGTETSSLIAGPISAGYLAYCKLFTDACAMRIPELEPVNQLHLCDLPRAFSGGDVDAFSSLLANWLGAQWKYLDDELDLATRFLESPHLTSIRHFMVPSLILLAAFKRDMLGPPTYCEPTRWRLS